MTTEKDRRHAELMAGFFSQLAVAFVAGAFLQIFFVPDGSSAAASTLFMAGLALHGIAHILIERSYGARNDIP